jgi:hypothetical protein
VEDGFTQIVHSVLPPAEAAKPGLDSAGICKQAEQVDQLAICDAADFSPVRLERLDPCLNRDLVAGLMLGIEDLGNWPLGGGGNGELGAVRGKHCGSSRSSRGCWPAGIWPEGTRRLPAGGVTGSFF